METARIPASRVLIVMPTWLGDTVMATPTLRAIRGVYPEAHLTLLISRPFVPILADCPWFNRTLTTRGKHGGRAGVLALGRRLVGGRFDLAVLLPNSFRSALMTRVAGIPRRLGYDRDGRRLLLTDRLAPLRTRGTFTPTSAVTYYLELAKHLGAIDPSPQLELFTRDEDDARAADVLAAAGYAYDDARPLVVLNPGAHYGDAKMWRPDRFAAVADRLVDEHGAAVAISGAPNEARILDEVIAAAKSPMIPLQRSGIDLRLLKSVIHRASLMVTNDTGPRHIAAAFGTPVVTIFGPTDPRWAEIDFGKERQVRLDLECSPCQEKVCPLGHHDCMVQIEPELVLGEARVLLGVER